ncbi:hypothetical protein [Candidatus Viridilinea mediisalina]|uniref:hypothetical protein n=1 Tax=Candidatus Viridilinea mediisalina TaxID=2024553 RepID=UPI0013FD43C5|nr:hypothetical protein [Candidatus Viridilinea mediisalina]
MATMATKSVAIVAILFFRVAGYASNTKKKGVSQRRGGFEKHCGGFDKLSHRSAS